MTRLSSAETEDDWFIFLMRAMRGPVVINKGLPSQYVQHTLRSRTRLALLLREEVPKLEKLKCLAVRHSGQEPQTGLDTETAGVYGVRGRWFKRCLSVTSTQQCMLNSGSFARRSLNISGLTASKNECSDCPTLPLLAGT
jgi:hypothetical protein